MVRESVQGYLDLKMRQRPPPRTTTGSYRGERPENETSARGKYAEEMRKSTLGELIENRKRAGEIREEARCRGRPVRRFQVRRVEPCAFLLVSGRLLCSSPLRESRPRVSASAG